MGEIRQDVINTPKTDLGVRVDIETRDAGVEGGHLGDVVVLPLSLLLLKLERDTTDGAALDTLHQVRRETCDLVAEAFRGDNSLSNDCEEAICGLGRAYTYDFIDDSLVGVEVKGQAGVAGDVCISTTYLQNAISSLIDGAFEADVQGSRMALARKAFSSDTHYFSMRTRDALLVVFVRTRPYERHAFSISLYTWANHE